MQLPAVRPASFTHIYVSGDVTIHPKAVVAPGAIFQAAPHSYILIEEGACIGMGAILNAWQGAIEVGSGSVLGAGVLVLGWGRIGKNASVGAATTIYNGSVPQMAVVPAGSLIGEGGAGPPGPEAVVLDVEEGEVGGKNRVAGEGGEPEAGQPPPAGKPPVVGQVYINNLLYALFPERRPREEG